MAQRDSIVVRQLQTVTIQQSRLNDYVIAPYQLPLDSAVLALSANGSLTDLLRKQGFGHMRTYGPGGLASPSFRGTGSSHTAVLWNGINLISPLLGQVDLSLVPAGLFDDATIQTGGSTSLSGNGSIGANIHLNNNLKFNEGLNAGISSHIGSFGNYYNNVSLRFSNKHFATSTKVFLNDAENNFRFINRNTFPAEKQRREHSAFHQHGLLQQLSLQTSTAGAFSLRFWYQQSEYEIPNATTIIRPSQATEENEFYRTLLGWNFSKEKFDINYQGALVQQALDYADSQTQLLSSSKYNSIIQNIETNFFFGTNSQLTSGIHYTWEEGIVQEYGSENPSRNRVALFSAFKFDIPQRWKFALSFREELVNGNTTPLAPTLSAKRFLIGGFEVFANVSRNYRIPTFNDLHWLGGSTHGNPDLKPELSVGGEVGFAWIKNLASFKIIAFSNHVDNWIQWSPNSKQGYEPLNIKKVWARGIESQLSASKKIGAVATEFTGQYSYTRSTNEDIYQNGNPNEKGKQLLLTPKHEGSIAVEGSWKKYRLRIVNAYTGMQFNDSDNTPYNIVNDYLITNLWLTKRIGRKHFAFNITGEVNNLFDVRYQARPGYPLPGINFKAGIQINFNKPTPK